MEIRNTKLGINLKINTYEEIRKTVNSIKAKKINMTKGGKKEEERKEEMAIWDKAANCVWITVMDMFCRERQK